MSFGSAIGRFAGAAVRSFREEMRQSPENPSTSLSNPDSWLINWMGGGPSATGIQITPETAMRSTGVQRAVGIRSEGLASVPLKAYELTEKGRREATELPLYRLLHDEPNSEMSSFELVEGLSQHFDLRGNAYMLMERDGAARLKALWPYHPDYIQPKRTVAGELYYAARTADGRVQTYPYWDVFHLRRLPLACDGLSGLSVISAAREAVGLSLAYERHGAYHFGNSAAPGGGYLTSLQPIPEKDRLSMKAMWEATHKGIENTGKMAVLGGGLEWKSIGMTMEDALYIEGRRFQLAEIARMFGVPLVMLDEHEKAASYNSVEQFMLSLRNHTFLPISVRFEKEGNRKFFSDAQRGRYYIKFNWDGLLRADTKSRAEADQLWIQNGVLSADEVRDHMELNPREDGQGDVYLRPANMVPAGSPVPVPQPQPGRP